jgi:hypothetical protein
MGPDQRWAGLRGFGCPWAPGPLRRLPPSPVFDMTGWVECRARAQAGGGGLCSTGRQRNGWAGDRRRRRGGEQAAQTGLAVREGPHAGGGVPHRAARAPTQPLQIAGSPWPLPSGPCGVRLRRRVPCTLPQGRPSPGGSRRPAACARLLGGGCAIVSRVRLKLVLLFCAVPVVVALLAWPPWKAGRGSPGALATERPAGGAAPRGAQAANRRPCMWGQPNPLGMWALPAPTDRAASTLLHAHACAGACGRLRMIMNPQSSDRLGRVEATCMRKRGRLQWRDRPAPSRVRAGGSQSVPQQAVQKGSAGGAKGPRAGWSAGELAASQVGARERAAALRARTGGTGGHMQAWARASGVSWRSPGSCRRCP